MFEGGTVVVRKAVIPAPGFSHSRKHGTKELKVLGPLHVCILVPTVSLNGKRRDPGNEFDMFAVTSILLLYSDWLGTYVYHKFATED